VPLAARGAGQSVTEVYSSRAEGQLGIGVTPCNFSLTMEFPVVTKTIKTTLVRDGAMCFIPLTFAPKAVFGKVRVPVKVTLNGYTYRSTIAAMGGPPCIPLRRSNREAAGVDGGETLEVRLDLDTDKREVKPPADFMKALKAAPPAWHRWRDLSYSHKREYAEAIVEAKKPETRARRIEIAVRAIRARTERKH